MKWLAERLYSSDAKVFGQSAFGTNSKFIKLSFKSFKKIKDTYYWFRYRFIPKYKYHIVYTELEPGYRDIDSIMLYANMSLLKRYVESEQNGILDEKCIYGGHDYASEIKEIYDWWIFEYKKDWEDYDKKLSSLYGDGYKLKFSDPDENGMCTLLSTTYGPNPLCSNEELNKLEAFLYEKEDGMLIKLMKLRRILWT